MHRLLFSCCFLLLCNALLAQPILLPLDSQQNSQYRTKAQEAAFPFYDDFSGLSLDADKWVNAGGAYINNFFGYLPPSLGVATFDGLNAQGQPYSFNAPSATGFADTLTSLPINLPGNGLAIADSLILSFYWQARGWGEQPNADDSLMLQFRDVSGSWIRQWAVSADSLTEFTKKDVVLNRGTYFHANFQFRFVNTGRLSGAYDTWNIDYVYLNAKARIQRPNFGIVRDVAFVGDQVSPIGQYSQIPLSQYAEVLRADSLVAGVRNVLGSPIGDNVTHLLQTEIYTNGVLSKQFIDTASSVNSFGVPSSNGTILVKSGETVHARVRTRPLAPWLSGDSAQVAYRFFLAENSENQNVIDTKKNDTITHWLHLGHSFAYDDGTAEFGWGINKKFGRLAYQFEAQADWAMNAVDLHIAKVGKKLIQGGFRIGIFQSIDTANSANDVALLPLKYFQIAYSEVHNGFQRLYFGQTIDLPKGKFYVVMEQLTDELLPIGFDAHRNSTDQMWISLGGTNWKPVRNFAGSLMMRPVFEPSTVTGLPEELANANEQWLYPNPTDGALRWKLPIKQLALYGLDGKMVYSGAIGFAQREMQLPKLPNGLYIAHIVGAKGEMYRQRLLISQAE